MDSAFIIYRMFWLLSFLWASGELREERDACGSSSSWGWGKARRPGRSEVRGHPGMHPRGLTPQILVAPSCSLLLLPSRHPERYPSAVPDPHTNSELPGVLTELLSVLMQPWWGSCALGFQWQMGADSGCFWGCHGFIWHCLTFPAAHGGWQWLFWGCFGRVWHHLTFPAAHGGWQRLVLGCHGLVWHHLMFLEAHGGWE